MCRAVILTVANVSKLIFFEVSSKKIVIIPFGPLAWMLHWIGYIQYGRFDDRLHTLISLSLHSMAGHSERYSIAVGLGQSPGGNHG